MHRRFSIGLLAMSMMGSQMEVAAKQYVWDTETLAWIAATPATSASGGGGDASAANQIAGNATLSSIDGKLPAKVAGQVPVVDVSVTEALDAQFGLLETISGNVGSDITTPVPAMPAGGSGLLGWLSAIWTKLNGSLAVTGTFWPPTQPVSLATNTPDITDRAGRLLGHVTVDTAPTTAVTGPLTDTQLRALAVAVSAAALPLPTGAATEAKQDTGNTALGAPADAEAAGNGSTIAILKRIRTLLGGTLSVNGTFWQATQPVSIALMPATPVTDNAGSLTVDANDASFGATVTPKAASTWDIGDRVGRLLGVIASITNALPTGDNVIGRTKITDGTNVQAVKAASTVPAATDPAAVVALSPNSPVGQVATSCTSVLQTTANTAQASQINIAAPGAGLFLYIDMIVITRVNNTAAAVAGDTTARAITSANLNGWAHECGSALAAGGSETFIYPFANGLKAAASNTAVTISTPAGGAGTKFRVTVTYRAGP